MIFRLARDELRSHFATVDLHHQNLSIVRLSAVCRLWRAVAIGDAVLWCNVAFSTSRLSTIRCAAEFVRRSRGAMLRVQIIDVQRDVHTSQVSSLMDEIARQSDRIAKFEVVGLSTLVSEALAYPANNLTHLTINGRGSKKLPLIFSGRLPQLRRLTLSSLSGWSLRAFPSVTKVIVYGGDQCISIGSLANFLDGASNLEKLSLSGLRGPRTDGRHAARSPIVLPSLRELRVAFCDSPGVLGHLSLPPSARASILSGYEPKNHHMLQYLPSTATFQPLLHGTQSLIITLKATSNGSYFITHRNGQLSCFLEVYDEHRRFDHGWVRLTVNAITEFKPFHLIKSLMLSVEQCTVPWKKWLPQLDRLVSMDVSSVDVEEIVYELSRIHPGQDGPLCPSLRYLSLERKGNGPALDSLALVSCLLARSRARHPITWLRIRNQDWTTINRADLGWKVLITSQGRSLYIANSLNTEDYVPRTPETDGGFTTTLMNG